eukprot:scaffold18341_cov53-Phaeocystis_antarctica.AAC.2
MGLSSSAACTVLLETLDKMAKLRAPAKVKGGRGWASNHEAHASTERSYAAAASAVRVGAARHWNGSAFPSSQAGPPTCGRAKCDATRCSGADMSPR